MWFEVRRQENIRSLLDKTSYSPSLKELVVACLNDNPLARPDAASLSTRVSTLMDSLVKSSAEEQTCKFEATYHSTPANNRQGDSTPSSDKHSYFHYK